MSIFLSVKVKAQVYQFISDKAMVVKLHSVQPYYVENKVSIIVDINNKKIIIDSMKTTILNIILADTTVSTADIKMINYKCIDEARENRVATFVLLSDNSTAKIGLAGHLGIDNGLLIYTYELHRKTN